MATNEDWSGTQSKVSASLWFAASILATRRRGRTKTKQQQLLQVPTAFTILPLQVLELREAGRRTLRASAEFQKLVQGLQAQDASVADARGASSMD